MKKTALIVFSFFLLTACTTPAQQDIPPTTNPITTSTKTVTAGKYTGSNYKGNYIYGAAMNLAWNDLTANIIHEPIQLKTSDADVLSTLSKLNAGIFTTKDLDEKSYYIKSGYGQKTVDAINQESRAKFPQKTFADLELKLAEKDIIAYAYLAKQVEYLAPFSEEDMLFDARYDVDDAQPEIGEPSSSEKPVPMKKVASFTATTEEQRKNVEIKYYENDNKFIVSLGLKDSTDQLFIAKGFTLESPDEVMDYLNNSNKFTPQPPNLVLEPGETPTKEQIENYRVPPFRSFFLQKDDVFEMPYLNLDYHRDYQEMIGQTLTNKNFEEYVIAQMFENIKFTMDYKGAKVENEAEVVMTETAAAPIKPPAQVRHFILDKPFWVIMKKSGSQNPYFILGVKNTEFMKGI